jgi:chromosome segregation protein
VAAELKALRWRTLDEEVTAGEADLRAREVAIEGLIARQRRIEAEGEENREAYLAASDDFNEVQGRYYAVGAEIARIEQGIQFARETRNRQEAELIRLERELAEARAHLTRDEETLAALDEALEREEPEHADAEEALFEAADRVATAEVALKDWESRWDDFNRRAAAPAQVAQAERARINQLETRTGQDRPA